MASTNHAPVGATGEKGDLLAGRLERADLVYYPVCPFPLPTAENLDFLLAQHLGGRAHKNISYDPGADRASGFKRHSPAQAERLRRVLAEFASNATNWLAGVLPRYAAKWRRDRVSFRPEEEATRLLRLTARNDLLHVDAFPSRPSGGDRLLRLFVNVNPTESRVWITSEAFPTLLERYGTEVGLATPTASGWAQRFGRGILKAVGLGQKDRTPYDAFMLRLHDFLKKNDQFQERSQKRSWQFAPGSAWLAFTDTLTHAALRGRYALEHSYFVSPESLVVPEQSPPLLFERARAAVTRRAA